jgi:hypothetical protein
MVHPRPSGVARLIRVHSPQVGVLRWTLRAAKSTTPTLLVSRSGLALEGASLVLIAHRCYDHDVYHCTTVILEAEMCRVQYDTTYDI